MYQLNKNYTWHNSELINPKWKLAPILDIGEEMKAVVAVLFYNDDIDAAREELATYDYSSIGTWEDADLISFILSLPEFKDSTIIPS